jgi:hypothetical protein
MTLIYVKDEERTIKSLCALIDKAPKMDVFKLEEVELDGNKGDIIILSKALRGHPCLEEFHMTSVTLTDAPLSLDQTVSMILDSVPDLSHVKIKKVPVSCTDVKTPIVPKSGLTDTDAITLAEVVARSPSIELTEASGHDLPDIGCVAFATAPDKNFSSGSAEQRTLIETAFRERAGGRAQTA